MGIFKETNPLVLELAFTYTHLGDENWKNLYGKSHTFECNLGMIA